MPPRAIPRVALHVRLPVEGHAALTAYAERKGISLNSAIWLLVQRGLEAEGVAWPSAPPSAGQRRRR